MALPGDVIAERYELEELLGEGNMGSVWAAKHRLTFKRVALKFLKDVDDAALVQRFVREARAASAVRHPNVIQVHDILQTDHGLALVMDLLEGESLEGRLQRTGPLPLPELAQLMSQVVSALQAVHAAGIVHRDLKPDNIFLLRLADGSSTPVLLDFGVCKLKRSHTPAEEGTPITKTGDIIGTPSYMAPEQIVAASEADGRADVWALGIILYECASGVVPFRGRSLAEVVTGILNAPITPLEELVPDLPRAFLELVERLLTRDPNERPLELADALATLRGFARHPDRPARLPLTTTRPTSPQRTAPAKASADVSGWFRTITRGKLPGAHASRVGQRSRLALFAGAMLLIGVATPVLLGRARRAAAPPAPPASMTPAVPSAAPTPPVVPASPAATVSPVVSAVAKAPAPKEPQAVAPARRKLPVTNFGGRR